MNVYGIDVELSATIYVKAANAEEARKKIDSFVKKEAFVSVYGPHIYGGSFQGTAMPEISLAPAMTLKGPYPESKPEKQ